MSSDPRILIAGIGNIFHGDDAFGVELAKRLATREWPDGVRVVDFGIRGLDLGYALLENYDAVILLDATSRGDKPGTLFVIDPEMNNNDSNQAVILETHGMVPEKVLRWAKAMGADLPYVRLIGCEPARLGSEDDMIMGLSEVVESVLDEAARLVAEQVNEFRNPKYDIRNRFECSKSQ